MKRLKIVPILFLFLFFSAGFLANACASSSTNAAVGRYIEVDHVKWYYEIHGEGFPLLYLHGALDSIEHFRKNIPVLAEHFKVIAVDRRGHGRSYDNLKPFLYSVLGEEVKLFLDNMKIDSAHVIGFSDGGNIGLYLASRYPQKIKKLIAIGSNYHAEGMTSGGLHLLRTIKDEDLEKTLTQMQSKMVSDYNKLNPQPNIDSFVRRGRPMWLTSSVSTDEMKQIETPVLFIIGDRDPFIRLDHNVEMYGLLKNGQLSVFPKTGHPVHEEKQELFEKIVIDFLSGE